MEAAAPIGTTVLPEQVAMLAQGTEDYGVGTIEKLYARHAAGMWFICMTDGPLAETLRRDGRRVETVGGLETFTAGSSVGTLLRFPSALNQARRDAARIHALLAPRGVRVVHSHWIPQQLMGGFLRGYGYKSAWQINNNSNPRRLFGLGGMLNHRLARWGADLLLPASDFIADNWRGAGVAMRTVRNAAEPIVSAPSALPEEGPLRCLVAGRMDHSKGHHLAVEAVIQLRARGHDIRLDAFGGPIEGNPYADALRARIADSGQGEAIRLMGFCADLRQRHHEYHLGLQCRIDPEPCSCWVCETLVDGLPLVAARNGGTPELVADGVTGLLFSSGDAGDLAEKIGQLAADRRRLAALRVAAFARGQAHFLPSRMMRETFDAYAAIC